MDAQEDSLITKRTGKGKTKEITLKVAVGEKLGEGNWGAVRRVHSQHKRRESLPFAYKFIEEGIEKSGVLQRQLTIHERLRKAENSQEFILPTFRQTRDGLLMTDLSDEGKNIVVSWNNTDQKSMKKLRSQHPELSEIFLRMSFADIDERIERIAKAVTKVGVHLETDCPFFVIYPNGTYAIYVADLDAATLSLPGADEEELYLHNKMSVEAIKSDIQTAQKNLQSLM